MNAVKRAALRADGGAYRFQSATHTGAAPASFYWATERLVSLKGLKIGFFGAFLSPQATDGRWKHTKLCEFVYLAITEKINVLY